MRITRNFERLCPLYIFIAPGSAKYVSDSENSEILSHIDPAICPEFASGCDQQIFSLSGLRHDFRVLCDLAAAVTGRRTAAPPRIDAARAPD